MREIQIAKRLSLAALGFITVVFVSVISELEGLGIITTPLLVAGAGCWVAGLILFIVGITKRRDERILKTSAALALLFLIAFIPAGFQYMKIVGEVRTKITVQVINRSVFTPEQVMIYGTGDIFENPDTLQDDRLRKGEEIGYVIRAVTKPHRRGYIRMEFRVGDRHFSKNIAGEFSVNPYQIQQLWQVVVDSAFLQ